MRSDFRPKKRMVIVGNGPLSCDFSKHVDAADFVVRFNEPKMSIDKSGVKTDLLIMSNSGKPMQRRLNDPTLVASPIFQAARELMFAYHPRIIEQYFRKPTLLARLKGRRADWTLPAIRKFGGSGKEIRIMPPQFYERGCRELGVPPERMHTVFPSTGYFGVWHALEHFPAEDWDIEICGFTWEGWRRHAWADERQWIANKVAQGRVRLIDKEVIKAFAAGIGNAHASRLPDASESGPISI